MVPCAFKAGDPERAKQAALVANQYKNKTVATFFVTLFDLPQNINNDKTRQLKLKLSQNVDVNVMSTSESLGSYLISTQDNKFLTNNQPT